MFVDRFRNADDNPLVGPELDESDEVLGTVRAIEATRFGGYTLVAKLGQGAMAEVMLALRTGQGGFQKLVVIKRMHAHLLQEPGVREMFMDEARLAALLAHPNVVQTNEVGEVQGLPFMAMEYLDGQPLSHVLARCKELGEPLPPPVLARLITDALDGLQHAHELRDLEGNPLGVVHRDVSPHNLFVGYNGVTKVLDFGVAKAAMQVARTEHGAIKGKYAYLSPEQAEQREVDARSDVWGMGVVLWECLTGRRLFKRDTEVATIRAVTEDEIPPTRSVAIDAPETLARIADRALSRDLSERYASAAEMRDELEAYLRGLPEPTRHRDVGRQLREMFEEAIALRRDAIAACVKGEMGDVSQAFVLGGDGSYSYSATGTEAVRSRTNRWLVALVVLLAAGLTGAMGWIATRAPDAPALAADEQPAIATAAAPVEAPAEVAAAPAEVADDVEPSAAEQAAAPTEDTAEAAPADRAAVETARAESPRRSRRRRPRRAPRPSADEAAPAPRAAPGFLFLDTTPWTEVSLGGRRLGNTPLMRVELPPGQHTLLLRNPEQGIEQRYMVEIASGETTRRRVGLR